MAECQKVCFDEEVIEEGRFQEVGQGMGDYAYAAQHVGKNQGNLMRVEAKKGYRCSNFCQVCLCLAVLALFIGLLLWLTTAPVFDFGHSPGHSETNFDDTQGHDFDCNQGYDDWDKQWNLAKKQFCCEHRGRGCEHANFDCVGSPNNWELDHRVRCCDKGVKEACVPAAHPYNCNAGLTNWKHGWSFGKKKWCCEKEKVGCAETPHPGHHPVHVVHVHHVHPLHHSHMVPVPAPAPFHYHDYHAVHVPARHVPYHCDVGLSQWTVLWSGAKKAYCCSKHSIFCGGAGFGGHYDHSHSYVTYSDSPHFTHADAYHGHAGYGYYTGDHSYSYGHGGSYGEDGYSYDSYGHGHFSHGGSFGHGHYSHHGGSYSASIPSCGESVAHKCPSDWATGTGGFHCLHQLARQTSHKAYLKSGGACRPAKQGPFPFNDCQDQCRIGSPHRQVEK